MDVTLHLGAHRTGSTSFQYYMRTNSASLALRSIGFWGPLRTRKGLLDGIQGPTLPGRAHKRAAGRIAMNLARAEKTGIAHLVISDENMIGRPIDLLRAATLYPDIGQRMARYHAAFGGRITQAVLVVRAQDHFWASLCAHLVQRGFLPPEPVVRAAIAAHARGWSDVIRDLSCALPGVPIKVVPFDRFAGAPDALLRLVTGQRVVPAVDTNGIWRNASPSLGAIEALLAGTPPAPAIAAKPGRWSPFSADQANALRERFADDLHWLIAGADGLAHYIDDTGQGSAPQDVRTRPEDRGRRRHERRQGLEGRLA